MPWIKLLPVVLMTVLGLAQLALEHRCRDRRTRKYRCTRTVVIVLFLATALATGAVVYREHRSGLELSSMLTDLRRQNDGMRGQIARLQEQVDDAKSARVTGIIFPSDESRPQHDCGPIPEGALALFFGGGVAWVDQAQDSIPLLSIGEQPIVTLYREPGGVYLSAIVLRQDGRGVATILGNRFGINPDSYFKVTSRDRHELVIVDDSGVQVLNARFLNESTFQLTGVFYVGPNRALVVEPGRIRIGGAEISGMCLAENKIGTAIFGF